MVLEDNLKPTFDVDDPRITNRIEARAEHRSREKQKLSVSETDDDLIQKIYQLRDEIIGYYSAREQAAELLNTKIHGDFTLMPISQLRAIYSYLTKFCAKQKTAFEKRKRHKTPHSISLLELELDTSLTGHLTYPLDSEWKKRLPTLSDYDRDPTQLGVYGCD